MKKNKFLRKVFVLSILIYSTSLNAQDAKKFFSSQDVKTTWLGVDFSEVRVMGDAGATPAEMKDRYFVSINDVIVAETEKYNIADAFRKLNVNIDLTPVSKQNSKIDQEKIKTYNLADLNRFTPELINKIVSNYNPEGKEGWGIVFLMEGMNKTGQSASMYVTLIDMSTGKVAFTKRMAAKPMGFGFRNYWARTVYEVLKDIRSKEYEKWKAESAN